MTNPNDDIKLKNYLREFQPIAPRPLPIWRKWPVLLWAAGLATVVVVAVLLIRTNRHIRPVPEAQVHTPQEHAMGGALHRPIIMRDLNAAAGRGDQALESALDASASIALPRVDRPNTALNILSGE